MTSVKPERDDYDDVENRGVDIDPKHPCFPDEWRYIFYQKDLKAARTILQTVYGTHAERSICEYLFRRTYSAVKEEDGTIKCELMPQECTHKTRLMNISAMVGNAGINNKFPISRS